MKTKASFKGHPIHQMLIPFPIGFLVGAFVFDLLGILMMKPSFWTTGSYLAIAGILAGLVAAIPGLIDYFFSVPPDSSARKRATKHMIVNLSSIMLFIAASNMRPAAELQPDYNILVIEFAALVLMGLGGWLGGTLATRNFIGPDHRYPNSGKWSEITVSAEKGKPVKVADTTELKNDQMKLIRINNKRIVLAKSEDKYIAFDDSCTHRGGSLAGGVLICGTVQCLWHGSQFDVKTGNVKAGPAEKKISTYDVDVKGNEIYLKY